MREPNAEGVKSECLSDGDVHRQVFSVDKFSSTEDLSVTKANKASVSKGWLTFFLGGGGGDKNSPAKSQLWSEHPDELAIQLI